jgi:hypothetical protein
MVYLKGNGHLVRRILMKVRIMGVDCPIKYDDKQLEAMTAMQGGLLLGAYSGLDDLILLNSNTPIAVQKDTLLHEIIEAGNAKLELDLEHDTIQALGSFFNQVIEDNPHLFTNRFKGVK